MSIVKISVPGGNGRMGKALIEKILLTPTFEISNSICIKGDKDVGIDLGILCGGQPINKFLTEDKKVLYTDTDVIVDFTAPKASLYHAKKCSEKRIPLVVGTTGFTKRQFQLLIDYSKVIPIVYSANFSIGIAVMQSLVTSAVKMLGTEWDIEILETHHKNKIDAPSGTALMLGETAAIARNQKLKKIKSVSRDGITGKRKENEIGFSVIRGGDVVGEHSMKFFHNNERIDINHTATHRSIFVSGALRSANWIINAPPGFYSLEDVLKKD